VKNWADQVNETYRSKPPKVASFVNDPSVDADEGTDKVALSLATRDRRLAVNHSISSVVF
jgi:hypothetical protein